MNSYAICCSFTYRNHCFYLLTQTNLPVCVCSLSFRRNFMFSKVRVYDNHRQFRYVRMLPDRWLL